MKSQNENHSLLTFHLGVEYKQRSSKINTIKIQEQQAQILDKIRNDETDLFKTITSCHHYIILF